MEAKIWAKGLKKKENQGLGLPSCSAAFIQVRISNIQLQDFFCHLGM